MTSLAEILHNIADHTETIFHLLAQPTLDQDFSRRVAEHIFFEEEENTLKLKELQGSDPAPLVRKLLDHSYFLQKIIRDESIPLDLKNELLHHFMEEHQEWQAELRPQGPERNWTVGPMWPKGER